MHIVPEQSTPNLEASARALPLPPMPWRRAGVVMPRLNVVSARDTGSAAPAIADAADRKSVV